MPKNADDAGYQAIFYKFINRMTLLEKIQCQMAALEIRVSLSRLSGIASTCSAAPFQIDAIKHEIEACLRQCDVMDLEIKKLQQQMDAAQH
jgi:hypothetical protein